METLIASILPGIAGMPNLHPMVVHFPIALLTSFLILEFLSIILKSEGLKTGATWMLYAGTLGAVVTVIAGFKAAGAVGHNETIHAIMETHERLGLIVLILAIILSIWRLTLKRPLVGKKQIIYLALSIVMVVLMSFGADLGGLMVYTHGVGVKAVPKTEEKAHDHNARTNEDKVKSTIEMNTKDAETDAHHDAETDAHHDAETDTRHDAETDAHHDAETDTHHDAETDTHHDSTPHAH